MSRSAKEGVTFLFVKISIELEIRKLLCVKLKILFCASGLDGPVWYIVLDNAVCNTGRLRH